ncbi:unnamed protein product [Pedinophyceae sp. YPF-701]|nr:unnamed protein product [Pedinophyceae sp. YPF-701]
MADCSVEQNAALKILLHGIKHPHGYCIGVLLGQSGEGGTVVADAVPLQHVKIGTSLVPDVGLQLIREGASGKGAEMVGVYQWSEGRARSQPAPAARAIAERIASAGKGACCLVVDPSSLEQFYSKGSPVPFDLWHPPRGSTSSELQRSAAPPTLPGGVHQLLAQLVRDGRHRDFHDLDDHMDDVTRPWPPASSLLS